MKNLIKILIVISLVLLFSALANAQSLEDSFIDSYRNTDDDDVMFVDYTFRDFAFIYDDIDGAFTTSDNFEIHIHIGDKIVSFYHVKNRNGKMYFILAPNLREYYLNILIKNPVDSVECWKISLPYPERNNLLHTIIPDDPNFFVDYYWNRFGDKLNNVVSDDPNYFIELCRPRFVGWENDFYKFFPNAKR